MEEISSRDNKKIKHILQLYKRKYRNTHKEFVAEGFRAVMDMLPTGTIRYVIANTEIVKEEQLQTLITCCHTYDVDVYSISSSIWKSIELTVHGQGVLAVACQRENRLHDFSVVPDGLYILLDGVQDPGNLGTLIRTAVAAGVDAMFLTSHTVDIYNEKTVRSTMSGLCKIPIYNNLELQDIQSLLANTSMTVYGTVLEDSVSYDVPDYEGPTMIVLGNEANGISKELLQLVQQRISIPMYGPMESLNVAIAGALCMYKVQEVKKCLSK